MRKRFEQQLQIGGLSISEVEIDKRSRHQLPQLMSGLQYIFVTPELNERVFEVLEEKILKGKKDTGRLGMSLWEILVLGAVRLNLDTDYDTLHDLSNHHDMLRGIMGVHKLTLEWSEKKYYPLQTIKDNVGLLDESTLNKISGIVVEAGHKLKKNESAENEEELLELSLKTDSYVVESNIHFPTDLWLLWDSTRKCLDTIALLKKEIKVEKWGKLSVWQHKVKRSYRRASNIHRNKGANYKDRLQAATQNYLDVVRQISERVVQTMYDLRGVTNIIALSLLKSLKNYHHYLLKLEDQVKRRILKGEKIAHGEKLFSIFEPHVEWITKGKVGKQVELGHRVLISTDQYHFIVDHEVMVNKTDKEVPIELGSRLKEQFKLGYKLSSISFDRGFYSLLSKKFLSDIFDLVVMPKAGKKSVLQQSEESKGPFKARVKKHSAVEANINELEHCGANKVRDKGLVGFHKYVAFSVLSYNLKRLGKIVIEKELLGTVKVFNKAA